MKTSRLLRIYLQDHDALASLTVQLIRRTRSNNEAGALGQSLDDLAAFSRRHHTALLDVMERLSVRRRSDKRAVVWIAEKLGRLKLNGRLLRYSDLSRLLELEGLTAVMSMSLSLWESLRTLLADDPRFADVDFDALIADAQRGREALGIHRIEAAKQIER